MPKISAMQKLKNQHLLIVQSFEFSLKDISQTDKSCLFAMTIDTPDRNNRAFFLQTTLERDDIPYTNLNGRRGRLKPEAGISVEEARELSTKILQTIDQPILDKDHYDFVTPILIRVNISFDDMCQIYAKALTYDSKNLRAYEQYLQDEAEYWTEGNDTY